MSRVLPVLFNAEMVRAILDGRKTVTRRALKHPFTVHPNGYITKPKGNENLCPYEPPYQPGDCLYVRETWQECCRNTVHSPVVHSKYCYKASVDSPLYGCIESDCGQICKWRTSIHMPKEAARIWLKVLSVGVERLQDITEYQIVAEGTPYDKEEYDQWKRGDIITHNAETYLRGQFQQLWNSTIKKSDIDLYGWEANPWVWVIEFERCEKPC